jgi:hypothetical protein
MAVTVSVRMPHAVVLHAAAFGFLVPEPAGDFIARTLEKAAVLTALAGTLSAVMPLAAVIAAPNTLIA